MEVSKDAVESENSLLRDVKLLKIKGLKFNIRNIPPIYMNPRWGLFFEISNNPRRERRELQIFLV